MIIPLAVLAGLIVSSTPSGLVIPFGTGVVRLLPYTDRTIRVSFYRGEPPAPSPAVVSAAEFVRWRRIDGSGWVGLRTPVVEARFYKKAGNVAFFDLHGRLILTERPGRWLQDYAGADGSDPANTALVTRHSSRTGGSSRLSFALQPGEAIYGLGQHQDGVMDYRGTSVHLQQKNMEVAIPMLLSSRGYGVLWDNPAITDVSMGAGPEEVVPGGALVDENGRTGALTGRYFDGEHFEQLAFSRRDAGIDFDWSLAPPSPALDAAAESGSKTFSQRRNERKHQKPDVSVGHDLYSVRWTGSLIAPRTGRYALLTDSDDGARLWLDGKLLIDDWTVHAAKLDSASVNLQAGTKYAIKIEFFQERGNSVMRFLWRLPTSAESVTWSSEVAKSIDYYFFDGPKPDAVIAQYRHLTGEVPMFGKWAWGFWQCKERYKTQQEIEDVVAHYRRNGWPLDGIIQDWQYWPPKAWGSDEFDPTRYPDPAGMVKNVHDQHAHIIISKWARFDIGSSNEEELDKAGALYSTVIDYGDAKAHYYDPFNPVGRRIYWKQISRNLFSKGFDGWWLDASEPELSGNWGEFRTYQTAAGPGAKVFNAFPLMHTTAVYRGQRAESSKKRVFILTRSAYAGQQRNSAVTWSGDLTGTWDVFAHQIPAALNFSMSGIPYWSSDTGGFFGGNPADPKYTELFTRWFQFSAFCPMFRVHGTNYPKEIWRFDPTTQKILVAYDRLRYRLLPYIYSTAWQVTSNGYTMMRALAMDFSNDPKVRGIPDEYMFGPDILVAPVTKAGASARQVYLPQAEGKWYDYWTDKPYGAGETINADAPISKLPLFVRAGSILPIGRDIQYAAQDSDPITLKVYEGADGHFDLYEDEGDNYDYEKGMYSIIPVTWNDRTRTLTIGNRKGTFPGIKRSRTFYLELVGPDAHLGTRTVRYSGGRAVLR